MFNRVYALRITRDVTGSFTLDVFKWVLTSINLGGSCIIICIPHLMGVIFFFCKKSHLELFHEIIVGRHPILMEQNLRKKFTRM